MPHQQAPDRHSHGQADHSKDEAIHPRQQGAKPAPSEGGSGPDAARREQAPPDDRRDREHRHWTFL